MPFLTHLLNNSDPATGMTAVCYIGNLFWKLYTLLVLKYLKKNKMLSKRTLFFIFWLPFLFYLQKPWLATLLQIPNTLSDIQYIKRRKLSQPNLLCTLRILHLN